MKTKGGNLEIVIENLKKGKGVIVVDAPERENQGDLIFPARKITPEKVNFLLKRCRGLICVAITKEQAKRLKLPLMVPPLEMTEPTGVRFAVSCDAKNTKSFGISAEDRAKTIKILANPRAKAEDLVRPGHIFPLLARDGGLLERQGHTEAGIDLMKLANSPPAAVLCEILDEKGKVANLSQLKKFSKKFGVPIIFIHQILSYLRRHPLPSLPSKIIFKEAFCHLLTRYGRFKLTVYRSIFDNKEHIALVKGKIEGKGPILTRIHSQCQTGEVFLSLKCDCKEQLKESLRLIAKRKRGVLIYLSQEGRGIGLANKIKSYLLQEKGLDTVEANKALGFPPDLRDYEVAGQILKDLGVNEIEILTNNPQKIENLKKMKIKVVKRIPICSLSKTNKKYLKTKKEKLGHLLKI